MILSQEAFLPSGDSVCVCFFFVFNYERSVRSETRGDAPPPTGTGLDPGPCADPAVQQSAH